MTVINPFDFFVEPYAEHYPFTYAPALAKELQPFLETAELGPRLNTWLQKFRATIKPEESTVLMLVRLNQQLQQEIRYLVRMEPGVQTPEETLGSACGSCRDTGWLLVQIFRHLGLPARFASGYLIQLVADIKPLEGPAGPTSDFTDLHAWAEVYLPGAGWIGFDPTSGLLAGEGHIPLACTADPGNAAPVVGYTDVAQTEFDVVMKVTRIHEDPRVTRPYSDVQWNAIDALGEHVDADLVKHDVRLTQGGEPTFVSIDDMDGPEWNTAALGTKKRELGEALLQRLRARFAKGGFVHDGQGKWYPGEVLPRWAVGVYWRIDGEPLWRDDALIADTRAKGTTTIDVARDFTSRLAERLGLPRTMALTVFEDVPRLLKDEISLPENLDPLKADLVGSRRAFSACPAVARGTRRTRRFRPPAQSGRAARRSNRIALGVESVAPATGTAVCSGRRFAARPALAVVVVAERAAGRTRGRASDRPVRASRRDTDQRQRCNVRRARCAAASRARWSRPRLRYRCATDTCTCSCRRSSVSRIMRRYWPRSRTPHAQSAHRSPSKVTRRPAILGCECSTSRPTPA